MIEPKDADRREGFAAAISLASSVRRGIVWMIALVGVGAGVLALQRSADGLPEGVSWSRVAGAALLYAAGMIIYGWSWGVLLDGDVRTLQLRFLVSQPAKYVPGGFAQPVSQVVTSVDVVEAPKSAVLAFPVHVLLNVASAATLMTFAVLWSEAPGPLRWLALIGLIGPLLTIRSVVVWAASVVSTLIRRSIDVDALPRQTSILGAYALGTAAHGLMASAFVMITASAIGGFDLGAIGIYAAAWLLGYVAVPFPAGVGAREAALVFLLAPILAPAAVVSLTVVHRVVTIAVELVLMGVAMVWLGQYRIARFK